MGFTDIYGRLMGKRMDAEFFSDSALKSGTHACNYLLTCDMEMTPQNGFAYSNWKAGYGDFHMQPDMKTFRKLSWLDRTGIVLCDILDPNDHSPVNIAPRNILKQQISACTGYKDSCFAMAASELEYYIYENSYRECKTKGYNNLTAIGDYLEDYHIQQGTRSEWINAQFRRHLRDSGVPVECTKGEAGYGQHELNVRYSEILEMADRHVIYKQCLKEVADLNGISVTFMCKPYTDATGSGCHIHLSLHDSNTGVNQFKGELKQEKLSGYSTKFMHFLGGWMKHTPEMFPFYAPTVNSYKRFVSASWAPTKNAWSVDNRTAGFRIVGDGNSLRIELRICGSDINPYLAFAASLAAGMDGIQQEIEPPKPIHDNIYSNENEAESLHLPTSLNNAIYKFRNSEWCNKTFGESVVEHYALFYELEQKNFERAVTDWERNRYFERI